MKNKRLIVSTVLLACVAALVVQFRRELWLAVGYETREIRSPDGAFGPMHCFVKRVRCLPGRYAVFPPQLCACCAVHEHGECLPDGCFTDSWSPPVGPTGLKWGEALFADSDIEPFEYILDLLEFRCTCSDPSHEWNR